MNIHNESGLEGVLQLQSKVQTWLIRMTTVCVRFPAGLRLGLVADAASAR